MAINWQDIKSFNNSQNNAFEELVCQLAREEPIDNLVKFTRVAAPDGGVEAYCLLENGEEYGWQAKFFSKMEDSQWAQLKKSFETTLRTHPNLTKYFICIPLDRQDPRHEDQLWFMDKWNAKTKEWTEFAKKNGRNINFEYWGSSELIQRLSQEKHAGRRFFWFSKEEFSDDWFNTQIRNSILNLGHRYTPKLNFELAISKRFDCVSRNMNFQNDFKAELHAFLKSFNKLDSSFLAKLEVSNFKNLLNSQFELSQKQSIDNLDIDALNENLKLINQLLVQHADNLRTEAEKSSKDSVQFEKHNTDNGLNALYSFMHFVNSPQLKLANLPVMLLTGEAGIGKSHLLADIATSRLKQNKACILLLGQHFSNDDSPWSQILRNLLRINCNEMELLGALNAKAEAQGERLIFFIDAINEGRGRYFWKSHIKSFVNDFSKYPWLGLVLSIRSSYEELLTPENTITQREAVRIRHYGFDGVEYQASGLYFKEYGIAHPNTPLLHPEFGNPLFLKLFCEGLARSNQKNIPKGYGGISTILSFFLTSVDEKLSDPAFFDYQPASSKKLVSKVINALIKFKLDNDLSYIPYESAVELANAIVSKYSNKKGFVDSLISEGVLSKNLYWNKSESLEGIYFAYERFEDHLTVDYLLTSRLGKNGPESLFHANGVFAKYLQYQYQYQGFIEALSVQLPEKTGNELYELVDKKNKYSPSIIDAFIQSLIWRKPETIKLKTKQFIEKNILNNPDNFALFFEMVYSVASEPEHIYNASFLHEYLTPLSMANRDSIWTTLLHDKCYEVSSITRLVDWALQLQLEGAHNLSSESTLLASKAIAWLLVSTNIKFRDTATKGLVCLLINNIPVATHLLNDCSQINDPYVYERIMAAIYGAVLNSKKLDGLDDLAKLITYNVFEQKEVYPNVLVRDYARNIVEYAIYKNQYKFDRPEIIRPPYKSKFPSVFPSNEEIDAYKFDWQGPKEQWGQNAILSSMVTEYGRGICHYGDFGRYTFQSRVYDWQYKFNPNDLSNYACKLIFEEYGYDIKKHGHFDNHAGSGDRHKNKVERIGKKYQWIALYEVLARLADNYQLQDPSSSWGQDKSYIWYQGSWEPFVRNIDPTLTQYSNRFLPTDLNHTWLNTVEYKDWEGSQKDWLVNTNNLPSIEDIVFLKDSKGDEWVVLDISLTWDEPVPVGFEQYEHPHKHLSYGIQSYFVSSKQVSGVIDWVTKKGWGQWLPECSDQYQVFSREYYWSPAYKYFDNPYYGRTLWAEVDIDSPIGSVMVASELHRWESGSDDEDSSYCAPREYMFSRAGLEYSDLIGEWLDSTKQIVCFDPSINRKGTRSLVIKKDVLVKFLNENELEIFWTCLGEKNIHGDMFSSRKETISKWLELHGVFKLENDQLVGNLEHTIIKAGSR